MPQSPNLTPQASPLRPLIIDIHTHIFPPEICRDRKSYFPGEPAFELLYRDEKKGPLSTAGASLKP